VRLAVSGPDMRKGVNGLALQGQAFGRTPHAGDLYELQKR
jgi:hypothetical protein